MAAAETAPLAAATALLPFLQLSPLRMTSAAEQPSFHMNLSFLPSLLPAAIGAQFAKYGVTKWDSSAPGVGSTVRWGLLTT